jgi:hypothetical protein
VDPASAVDAPVREAFSDIENLDPGDAPSPESQVVFQPVVMVSAAVDAVFETSVGVIHRVQGQDRVVVDASRGQPSVIDAAIRRLVTENQQQTVDVDELVDVLERPLPDTIRIDGYDLTRLVSTLFDQVLLTEEHTDLAKAVDSYRAAIQSFHSEVHVRLLYSVCENALFSGNPAAREKDRQIAAISSLDQDEAEAWRHLVNRTKHPDEGTPYDWAETFEDVPPPVEFRMRDAANQAIRRELDVR